MRMQDTVDALMAATLIILAFTAIVFRHDISRAVDWVLPPAAPCYCPC